MFSTARGYYTHKYFNLVLLSSGIWGVKLLQRILIRFLRIQVEMYPQSLSREKLKVYSFYYLHLYCTFSTLSLLCIYLLFYFYFLIFVFCILYFFLLLFFLLFFYSYFYFYFYLNNFLLLLSIYFPCNCDLFNAQFRCWVHCLCGKVSLYMSV